MPEEDYCRCVLCQLDPENSSGTNYAVEVCMTHPQGPLTRVGRKRNGKRGGFAAPSGAESRRRFSALFSPCPGWLGNATVAQDRGTHSVLALAGPGGAGAG